MALETVPKDLRHLRACLLCSLVKTIDQFEYDGCDNCDAYLQMKGNREMVYDCTSSSFDGRSRLTMNDEAGCVDAAFSPSSQAEQGTQVSGSLLLHHETTPPSKN
ncbi:mCG7669, isoform CRA_b [Mus musculus]|uniref:SPT4A, DSIF elongation factor subunit n=1 Tax=Mus musculus TaxID=10090 RepID=D6RHM5_MOUSE|nr:mCG7669, isoform CRA_b [Mus musculus]